MALCNQEQNMDHFAWSILSQQQNTPFLFKHNINNKTKINQIKYKFKFWWDTSLCPTHSNADIT